LDGLLGQNQVESFILESLMVEFASHAFLLELPRRVMLASS
jgi:hypothetical protein